MIPLSPRSKEEDIKDTIARDGYLAMAEEDLEFANSSMPLTNSTWPQWETDTNAEKE